MRELADESHRVGEQHLAPIRAHHAARRGVERREQAVLDQHVRARERVEQRALSRVRIAHERGAELAAAPAALGLALAVHRLELALEAGDALVHPAAVALELRFARPARADAAGLALEVLPHAGEPRQRVLELRELDLQPRFAGARTAREDVEDQLGAIHDLDAERLLEIAHLGRREVVVEDRDVRVHAARDVAQLVHLAASDVVRRVYAATPLPQRRGGTRARGVGEARQLLHRALERAPFAGGVPDQHGAFDARGRLDFLECSQPRVSISSS